MDMQRNKKNALIQLGQTKPIQPSIVLPPTRGPLKLVTAYIQPRTGYKRLFSRIHKNFCKYSMLRAFHVFCLKCQNHCNFNEYLVLIPWEFSVMLDTVNALNLKMYVHYKSFVTLQKTALPCPTNCKFIILMLNGW